VRLTLARIVKGARKACVWLQTGYALSQEVTVMGKQADTGNEDATVRMKRSELAALLAVMQAMKGRRS
jgi:hypothetical protein